MIVADNNAFIAGSKTVSRASAGFIVSLILSVSVCILMNGCAQEQIAVDTTPPGVIAFTPRNPDTTLVEQGIDAVPDGDYITMSWQASGANDLAGYRLYRRNEDLVGADRVMIAELSKNSLEYEDHDSVIAPDQTTGLSSGFSYWVTAFDASGNESGLSESAYYKLMPKPELNEPVLQGDTLSLSWTYDSSQNVDYFAVRLFRLSEGSWQPFWITVHELFYPLTVTYTEPLAAGTYRFQVDVVGAAPEEEPAGSEKARQFDIP